MREGLGREGWGGRSDTKRYKGTRYLLEVVGVVGGVGVEVLLHRRNRPLMHGLGLRAKTTLSAINILHEE